MSAASALQPDAELLASLRTAKLIDDSASYERLTGGISSDIWKVTTPEGTVPAAK